MATPSIPPKSVFSVGNSPAIKSVVDKVPTISSFKRGSPEEIASRRESSTRKEGEFGRFKLTRSDGSIGGVEITKGASNSAYESRRIQNQATKSANAYKSMIRAQNRRIMQEDTLKTNEAKRKLMQAKGQGLIGQAQAAKARAAMSATGKIASDAMVDYLGLPDELKGRTSPASAIGLAKFEAAKAGKSESRSLKIEKAVQSQRNRNRDFNFKRQVEARKRSTAQLKQQFDQIEEVTPEVKNIFDTLMKTALTDLPGGELDNETLDFYFESTKTAENPNGDIELASQRARDDGYEVPE